MTSLNRRQLTTSLLAGSLSAALGGCTTTWPPRLKLLESKTVDPQEEARLAALSITHPDREEEFNVILQDLYLHTNAVPISDDRVRIRSVGSHSSREDVSEQDFLLRAAAETLRTKQDGFVIMHLDYHDDGLNLPSLTPNLSLSSRRWIGNYEDLRVDRNEQNIFSHRRKVKSKALDGVILKLNKSDFPNRDRFSASEIYLNLLNYKAR